MAKTKIVILGGGFGGVYTATYLEKLLKPEEADIHLVSRDNYLVFSPMLPELISGSIELFHAITPIRELCHRTHLHTREVEQIDLEGKTVTTSPGIRAIPHQITYDHLVLALGTQLSFRGMPGLEQHGIPFKNVGDTFRIRNHVIHALEEADIETDPEIKQELLTFVVAGGGFAGVEGVAELNDFLREAAKSYVSFKPADIKVILLHAQDRILQEIKEKLGLYAQHLLQKRGVEIRFNTRLAGASACEAILTTGEKIPTRTIITTVPSAPNPLLAGLPGAKENRGKVPVNEQMQLLSHPGVWGLGDCCLVPAPGGGEPDKPKYSPPTAQHAIRQAKIVAHNITAQLRGTPLKEYDFSGLGTMGALGKYSAVAEMFGKYMIEGFPAWVMWRGVYLGKLPGWDRKARVALDWMMDLFTRRDIVRLNLSPTEAIKNEHFEPGEYVFQEGDLGDQVYIIISGEVEVIRMINGVEQVIAELGPKQPFGEMALLNDRPRNASIRAVTAVDTLTIAKHDFARLVDHFPGVKEGLQEFLKQRVDPGVLAGVGAQSNAPTGDGADSIAGTREATAV